MNPVAIVQARQTGSTRFGSPKVLAEVYGEPLLWWTVRRLQQAKALKGIVIAIPEGPENDALADLVLANQWNLYRGPEQNVLERYLRAAEEYGADPIIRVTADEPMLDPGLVNRVVQMLEDPTIDYVASNLERTFPLGLDVEGFTYEALMSSVELATEPHHQEHVTDAIREHPHEFSLVNISAPDGMEPYANWRLTVDYPSDLELFNAIALPMNRSNFRMSTADILWLIDHRDDLRGLASGITSVIH